MKRFIERLGILLWWLSLPGLIVYLWGKPRTRVLVRCEGKLLVVRSWLGTGKWMLPGGGLHKDEPVLDCAVREVREETGLLLEPDVLRPLFQETYRFRGMSFPCYYFVADIPGPQEQYRLRPQALEISRVAWVEPTELTPRYTSPDIIAALEHAEIDRT
jgi:8-oxo-dGTP pyrophosphatase MutT (NUDIX family)